MRTDYDSLVIHNEKSFMYLLCISPLKLENMVTNPGR